MPDTLVLLARIIVHVSASNVSTTMTVKTHQQQVFSQVSPVLDFKFMSFPFSAKANFFTDIYILVGIWGSLYEEGHLLALTEFREREGINSPFALPGAPCRRSCWKPRWNMHKAQSLFLQC